MVSRRILRIKVMQALYAYFKHDNDLSIKKVEKELVHSILKTHDLYHYFLLLLVDIADYAGSRIEIARNKKIPLYEDIHPNTKFVENKIIHQLRINKQMLEYLTSHKFSWDKYPELIKGLYNSIIENSDFKKHMSNDLRDYSEDKKFICQILKNVISTNELLYTTLEEESIYWNDEIEFVISIVIKTILKFKEDDAENASLMPLYKNKDDEEYPKILMAKVILHNTEYREMIEKHSKNWDVDRIAFMDILLMQMCIAEAVEFSSIPVKVSLNEYLELSKYYSTPKSNVFINGVLDKVFTDLKNNKKIKKTGRGLIGDD